MDALCRVYRVHAIDIRIISPIIIIPTTPHTNLHDRFPRWQCLPMINCMVMADGVSAEFDERIAMVNVFINNFEMCT